MSWDERDGARRRSLVKSDQVRSGRLRDDMFLPSDLLLHQESIIADETTC